jgi:hypothetical protein
MEPSEAPGGTTRHKCGKYVNSVAVSPQSHELLAGKERRSTVAGVLGDIQGARQMARASSSISHERITTPKLSDRYLHRPRPQLRMWNEAAVEPHVAQVPVEPEELWLRISSPLMGIWPSLAITPS